MAALPTPGPPRLHLMTNGTTSPQWPQLKLFSSLSLPPTHPSPSSINSPSPNKPVHPPTRPHTLQTTQSEPHPLPHGPSACISPLPPSSPPHPSSEISRWTLGFRHRLLGQRMNPTLLTWSRGPAIGFPFQSLVLPWVHLLLLPSFSPELFPLTDVLLTTRISVPPRLGHCIQRCPRHAWCLPAPAWGPPAFSSFIFLTVAPTPVHISEQSQLGLACFPTWKRELRWPGSILLRVGSQSPEGGSVHLLSAEHGGRSAAPRAQALLGKGAASFSWSPLSCSLAQLLLKFYWK